MINKKQNFEIRTLQFFFEGKASYDLSKQSIIPEFVSITTTESFFKTGSHTNYYISKELKEQKEIGQELNVLTPGLYIYPSALNIWE